MIKISRSNGRSVVCLHEPRGGSRGIVWNFKTTELDRQSISNRTLLERLELENAELRDRVLHLVLQIQALRDGATTWLAR
jgi:hypothetical protein